VKAKDSYEDRLKMVDMHGDILKRIDDAIKRKQSVEACWLCYACFESRIVRTLEKVSEACGERRCYQNHKVGISTRIDCIKRLMKQGYTALDKFDANTLGQVHAWCKERNTLVHSLLTLNNYEGMDDKFLTLARRGKPLVERLYAETTEFRTKYYELAELPPLFEKAMKSCRLLKKQIEKECAGTARVI